MIIEGVPYYPFIVTFRTTDGKRHKLTHWSPGYPWVRQEVARGLDDRFGISEIVPGSCAIQQRRDS
jgi:hypothetical protein